MVATREHNRTTAYPPPSSTRRMEARGVLWIVAAFLFCPCHLPLTLGLAALLLAGTTAGALLNSHPLAAGGLVSLVWSIGTWRGFHLLRAARRCAAAGTGCGRP
jgi:hypothetical protein